MNPLIRKLCHGSALTDRDQAVLFRLVGPERLAERGDILPEGREPRSIVLVVTGWACRYKQLENGKRQITALFLPGDICEPFGALPRILDHTLAALTPVRLANLPLQGLREAARTNLRIEQALWWDLLLSNAVTREHMVSLGRRTATERLGHFFCEVQLRLGRVGLAGPTSCEFPLIQPDLADLFGLTPVHVNRSLQELRASGLVSLRDRQLTIHHPEALRELSMFDPAYLQQTSVIRDWTANPVGNHP